MAITQINGVTVDDASVISGISPVSAIIGFPLVTVGPDLVASYDFNAPNFTDINGSDWNSPGTYFLIYENALYYNSSGVKFARWIGATASQNQRTELNIEILNGGYSNLGASVRVQSGTDDGYTVETDGTALTLYKVVLGVKTSVWSNGSAGVGAGDRIAIEATGTGSATRLAVQVDTGSGWTTETSGVDPAAYFDGGTWAIMGSGNSDLGCRVDTFRGYDL